MEDCIEALKNGKIILYPTDTIWGIGCDATNEEACQKIVALKGRSVEKSFILLVDGFPMLEKYIPDFNPICYDLVDFSSKPLTIIYPEAINLAPTVIAEDGSVGIRITSDPTCLKLIRSIRKPIVSTSANLSGLKTPKNFHEVDEKIKNGVDSIVMERIDENCLKSSQIIKIGLNGEVKIIRS